MPEVEVMDVTDIDLSKLISYTMSFEPLQLIFKSLMDRLKDMESAKERHEEEIAELKRSIKELQNREMETPEASEEQPPLDPIRVTQERAKSEEKKHTMSPQKTKRESTHVHEPVDLIELWEEIERLKKLVGDGRQADRRHTIEELYAARRRKESAISLRGPSATPPGDIPEHHRSSVSDPDAKVGDIILDRAKELLPLTTADVEDAQWRESGWTEAPTGEAVEPARREAMEPLHDEGTPLSGKVSLVVSRPGSALVSAGRGGEERAPMRHSSDESLTPLSRGRRPMGNSISERLRKDGSDIEHLNRVVAEMLNEMKGLHADVDNMRTVNLGHDTTLASADNGDLSRRVLAIEDALKHLRLSASLNASTATLPEGATATELRQPLDLDLLRRLPGALDELRSLGERLTALERTGERVNEKFTAIVDAATGGEGTSFQQALFASNLAAVERQLAELQRMGLRNCDADIAALQEAVRKMQADIAALQELYNRLLLQTQTQPPRGSSRVEPGASGEASAGAGILSPEDFDADTRDAKDYDAAIQDLMRHTEELSSRMADAEGGVKYLDEEKADRATLQRFNDDLQQLRRLLELSAASRGDADATGLTTNMQEDLLNMQKQLSDQLKESGQIRDAATNELDMLREYVEKIDNCKADATLVANKAERDYVENALERLMREVEQVLNATNAGLIDTLDRSLNVLRDMLEGKATKQDMAQLQRIMAEEGSGAGAPDALTGFKGYRCLGCNRAVDTMRPRAMGNRLQPFVNRLPQGHANDITARIQQGPAGGATDGAPSGATA